MVSRLIPKDKNQDLPRWRLVEKDMFYYADYGAKIIGGYIGFTQDLRKRFKKYNNYRSLEAFPISNEVYPLRD